MVNLSFMRNTQFSRRMNIHGPDAEASYPQRREHGDSANRCDWAYFSFSGGPRT